ncbi:TIGR01777 family oxidoreductase [Nocardioides sp.]|uniref:TIGR01777 family oxidoreductase n=1 Tax=Nocardioides sp. TaxID=35761 RepID=UPI002CA99A3E|nr:TIGR01777 family oxidoreductase [Nocardioides sp.]HXH80259.1 TIGR01777 family oxidoreductase [Nocardioides sp.]
MKIVIPGGTGQVGGILRRALSQQGHEVVVLSRRPTALEPGIRHVRWDGRTVGDWAAEIDGADAVINLAGRTVNCRYTDEHRAEMMDSRVDSTQAVGQAIERAERPPRVWLQTSTATIYEHTYGPAHGEDGRIGGGEEAAPASWAFSVEIAQRWEAAQQQADTPRTRRVALRSALVMSPDRGGVFDILLRMARLGVGGPVAGGRQYVSWIHEHDFVRAVELLLTRDDIEGPVNLASPFPVPQRELMKVLRNGRIGLPATRLMAEMGAFVLRSETELLLKSRRVVPARLLEEGFVFDHPTWPDAAADLVRRHRTRTGMHAAVVGVDP